MNEVLVVVVCVCIFFFLNFVLHFYFLDHFACGLLINSSLLRKIKAKNNWTALFPQR